MEIVQSLNAVLDAHLQEKFHRAVSNVQRTIDLYGFRSLAFSFNGGKDSTVLLHILRAAVALYRDRQLSNGNAQGTTGLGGILTFFFPREDDFREIMDFVHATDKLYGLQMQMLKGDFKAGIQDLVAGQGIKAIFLGTRRGDPNAVGQDEFCPSSPGWPPFMRVNPVLGWTYSDVWAFLRASAAPYCCLYDRGFTSLGSTSNTRPNSALRKEDGSYAPAHALADNRMERAGRCSSDAASAQRPPAAAQAPAIALTAALVMVGDELLSGRVEDANSRFLCRELHALGWHTCRVATVRDEVGAIAAEVRAASDAHDIVITSGGVGPTVDDVTMAGVSDAFGHHLTRDQDLEHRLRLHFGPHFTQAHFKMAEAPAGEVSTIDYALEDGKRSPFPVIRCRNVFILPGVPHLLQQKWRAVKEQLAGEAGSLAPFHSVSLRLGTVDETAIAPALERLSTSFEGCVGVGSYPVEEQSDGTHIILSLQSKDATQLEAARCALIMQLPQGSIIGEQRNNDGL